MPCKFTHPQDNCAQVDAFIAPSLCGCELINFSTFRARIPLLQTDSGPLLRREHCCNCGLARIYWGILGADIGPRGSPRAMQFRGPTRQPCPSGCFHRCVGVAANFGRESLWYGRSAARWGGYAPRRPPASRCSLRGCALPDPLCFLFGVCFRVCVCFVCVSCVCVCFVCVCVSCVCVCPAYSFWCFARNVDGSTGGALLC